MSSKQGVKRKRPHRKGTEESTQDNLPGVQKIKSALRQTRRLLAKDNLAADVRIETERRLQSLETDLVQAERSRKERNLATKYHKVKFFERQKVFRKIKRTKKLLEDDGTSPESLSSLRETLFSQRVDLNYILHYPKTKKYISLFPPKEASHQQQQAADGSSETDRQRESIRHWVSSAMEKGEMDAEPEEKMRKEDVMDWEQDMPDGHLQGKRLKRKDDDKLGKSKAVEEDDFFEGSDDESGGGTNAGDDGNDV